MTLKDPTLLLYHWPPTSDQRLRQSPQNLDASMGRHASQALEPARRLLLEDDTWDEELDTDSYEDTRAEMMATGHNVTSVLMNPRETMLENMMDEFAFEQSTVLEKLHPILPVTSEVEECQRIVLKLRALIGKRNKTLSGTMVTRAPTKEDVEMCFREVPSIFFRPVTSHTALLKAEDLQEMLQFSAVDGPGLPPTMTGHSPSVLDAEGGLKGDPDASTAAVDTDRKSGSGVSPVSIPSMNGHGGSRPAIQGPAARQQERLSQYLDLVEVALLKQIWSRSPAFFRASDDIRALQEQVKTAGYMISARRRDLQNIAAGLKSGALRIPYLHKRANNQRKLLTKLSAMQRVLDGRSAVECLMAVEDHLGALQVTTDTLHCYRQECSSIAALRSVGVQLQEYEELIGQVMCDKFATMGMSWEGSDASDEAFSLPMTTLLRALLLVRKSEPALQLYTTRMLDCIKIIVKSCVSEYVVPLDTDIEAPSGGHGAGSGTDDSPFTVRVKEMTIENFFACLEMCYEQLMNALRKAERVNSIIVECLIQSISDPPIADGSPRALDGGPLVADVTRAVEISVTCIKSICDAAQRYLSQFLVLRKDSCVAMNADQMKNLYSSVSSFVLSLEQLLSSGTQASAPLQTPPQSQAPHTSSAYTLRKTLVGIVKNFIDKTHDHNKSRLVATLDAEKWVQCDISEERLDNILSLATGRAFLARMSGVSAAAGVGGGHSRSISIDNQTFIAAWSALLLIEMLMDYIGFATVFSGKVTEESLIPKMVELLQLFDTHAHRLVLGAQATKAAAALKSISARHLAVTVQSIGLIMVLLPHMRTALMGYMSGGNSFLVELDRVSNQYAEHQSKVLTKFVTIVGEAVDSSCEKKLRGTDWDRFNGQCEYFEEVIRNVSALHRVLVATLPPEQVQNVYTRIFMHLNRKVPQHFDDIMPATQTGKQRILDEVSHLVVCFQQLPHINAGAVTLEESFRKRYGDGLL